MPLIVSLSKYNKVVRYGNISPIWGETPTPPIETKICVMGHLADVITYAKFQDDIFRGYDFTGGWISHFPVDCCMGLTTVQRDCAACDIKREVFVTFIFAVFYHSSCCIDLCIFIGLPLCISLPNFVVIGGLSAELCRHIHFFSTWRPAAYWIWSG